MQQSFTVYFVYAGFLQSVHDFSIHCLVLQEFEHDQASVSFSSWHHNNEVSCTGAHCRWQDWRSGKTTTTTSVPPTTAGKQESIPPPNDAGGASKKTDIATTLTQHLKEGVHVSVYASVLVVDWCWYYSSGIRLLALYMP
jgi:hypothetical protein